MNMCETNPAALLRAQNTCVYVTSHLIHSQHLSSSESVSPSMVYVYFVIGLLVNGAGVFAQLHVGMLYSLGISPC